MSMNTFLFNLACACYIHTPNQILNVKEIGSVKSTFLPPSLNQTPKKRLSSSNVLLRGQFSLLPNHGVGRRWSRHQGYILSGVCIYIKLERDIFTIITLIINF